MPQHPYSSRYLVALVTLLMLVSIVNVADKELLAPVADAVQTELRLSDTQLGSVRSAVFLAALSASNIVLNSVIALLSFLIGVISDATELRWAFGGAVLLMYGLGILVCLALLRTVRRDMDRQQALVHARIVSP